MTDIVYTYGNQAYLNITNACPCRCTFCIRNNGDSVGEATTLWFEHSPSIDEIKAEIDNFDFTTNITAVLATLNNTGPGFEMVGPTGNFSIYSDFSKLILMFDMLAGRLELFPMLIILVPSCWRKY